jgi:SAM-dependent methyltransferase
MSWPAFLRAVHLVEVKWTTADPAGLPAGGTPFIPMHLGDFMLLITEAMLVARPARGRKLSFLDVGAGPGTKVRVAEQLGMRASGIDPLPGHVAEANRGRTVPVVAEADARTWDRYGEFDIVLLNRPVQGQQMPGTELRVMEMMRPGGVLIHANGWTSPDSELGWDPVYVKTAASPVTGVWRKPGDVPHVITEVENVRLGTW